jgi:hypothetical protein
MHRGAVCLFVVVSALSCRQIVGIRSEPEGPANEACGLTYAADGCASCVSASCCAESTACAGDPVCAPAEACVAACAGDPQCRLQCLLDHRVGTSSEVVALDVCIAANCETACSLPACGGFVGGVGGVPPDAAVACQGCLAANSSACSAEQACATSIACSTFFRCWLSCATYDCRQACALEYGSASAATIQTLFTTTASCGSPCALGNDWTCVGSVSWPTPKGPTSVVTIETVDLAQATSTNAVGLPGQVVSYCAGGDGACNSPLAHGSTMSNGRVMLTVPIAPTTEPTPTGDYFQVRSEDAGSDSGIETIQPELLFLGFPLSEARYSLVQDVPSDEAFITGPLPVGMPSEWSLYAPSPKPGTGLIVAEVVDCNAQEAVDVEVTTSPPTTSDAQALSSYLFLFRDVTPGYVTVIATPNSLGRPSSSVPALVRPGQVTVVILAPTPNP